jgi:hypothetical protein
VVVHWTSIATEQKETATEGYMSIGVTRYLVLLIADFLEASSISDFIEAAEDHSFPKRLLSPGWLSGAISGSGSIPRRPDLRQLFFSLTDILEKRLTPKTKRSRLLRMTDAAKSHFEEIYVSVEEARRAIKNDGREEHVIQHLHELSEWREHIAAWSRGLERHERDLYRSALVFKRIFLALVLSELCFDLATLRERRLLGRDIFTDEFRISCLIEATEALGAASTLLEEIQRDVPTPRVLLRIQSNYLVATGMGLPYKKRFTNPLLAVDWQRFAFSKTLSQGSVLLSSLVLRNLIELAMYVHLDDPSSVVPPRLVQEWECFDEVLERNFSQFKNGNRKKRPKNWGSDCLAIADDPDLTPYMRWLATRQFTIAKVSSSKR